MFSNRFLPLKILVAGSLILACLTYARYYAKENRPEHWHYVLQPDRYDGWEIRVSVAKVLEVGKDSITVRREPCTFTVRGFGGDVAVGDIVTLRGIFHKEGYVEVQRSRVYSQLYVKRTITWVASFFILFIVAYLFFKEFRLAWGKGIILRR
jgi:hypothetical protein